MPKLRMNLQYFAGEKTEKATPRRKQESRQKGQVAKSAELPSAIIF
nr:EscU/YscU/HrcU family type III secretion system export apparatus switch protein [Tepidibacillus decaturensis]